MKFKRPSAQRGAFPLAKKNTDPCWGRLGPDGVNSAIVLEAEQHRHDGGTVDQGGLRRTRIRPNRFPVPLTTMPLTPSRDGADDRTLRTQRPVARIRAPRRPPCGVPKSSVARVFSR